MSTRSKLGGALIGLLSLATLGVLALRPTTSGRAGSSGAAPTPSTPGADAPAGATRTLSADDPAYRAAARALRARDCDRAQAALASLRTNLDDEDAGTAASARLVSGLYAHACEDVALAAVRLAEPTPDGWLEDWRLLILAESAHALGERETADVALTTLLDRHPDSPLWERALLTAIDQAIDSARPARLLDLVARSRERETLSAGTAAQIETLAWETASGPRESLTRAKAGRRLLTLAPDRADELGLLDLFRQRSVRREQTERSRQTGEIDWSSVLTPAEILQRAEALLEAGRPGDALATLDDQPAGERDTDWYLLAARALTRGRRAGEALDLLGRLGDEGSPEQVAHLAWERYRAAEDLASPLRSGTRLSPAERRAMREEAHDHLGQVVAHGLRGGADPDLARSALRRLFADSVEDERFDEAKAVLLVLRRIDPDDATGTGYLWSKGWEQYRRRNFSGAVGYWSELTSLYPDSGAARAGRYWTARAFEQLGHRERSRELFEEVAAARSTDFYRRHALARLQRSGGPAATGLADSTPIPLPSGDPPAEQPWPRDPALERARRLTELGLDALALAEIEGLERAAELAGSEGAIDPRARNALKGVALSHQGKRRAAIPHLRRAFPALGGPHQTNAPAEALRLYYPVDFRDAVEAAASSSGLPAHMVYGMIREESAFDVTALSHAGARGLMQLMPGTAREVSGRLGLPYSTRRLDDPAFNIRLGSAYFARVLDMFDGRTELALAGYNGGPYRLKRLWRRAGPGAEIDFFTEALPIEESKGYVKRVILFANSYHEMYGF